MHVLCGQTFGCLFINHQDRGWMEICKPTWLIYFYNHPGKVWRLANTITSGSVPVSTVQMQHKVVHIKMGCGGGTDAGKWFLLIPRRGGKVKAVLSLMKEITGTWRSNTREAEVEFHQSLSVENKVFSHWFSTQMFNKMQIKRSLNWNNLQRWPKACWLEHLLAMLFWCTQLLLCSESFNWDEVIKK